MANISESISEIEYLNSLTKRETYLNKLNPIAKLIVTIGFIIVTISFSKYDLSHLILMFVYLIICYFLGDLSFISAIKKTFFAIPLIVFIGIFNPLFDREVLFSLGSFSITTGMISFLSLVLKGLLTIFASYGLAASTSSNDFCYALHKLKCPNTIIIVLILSFRYIILITKEAENMWQAYSLRAPKHKGLHINVWGSFIGNLLLRSIDRAENIYESMYLRGFDGSFKSLRDLSFKLKDLLYILIWISLFVIIRFISF